MSLRLRLIIAIVVVAGAGWAVAVRVALAELRPRYLEAIEDSLHDTVQILAGAAAGERPDTIVLARAFAAAQAAPLPARIHAYDKGGLAMGAYCTDAAGIVLWHSDDPAAVGRDFSRWNDVARTLQGRYGARATAPDGGDPLDAVLHVAAPVRHDGRLVGVVTVFKAGGSVAVLEAAARRQLLWGALVVFVAALAASVAVAWWVTDPLARLTRHVERLRVGHRETVPAVGGGEIGRLAAALAELRAELEGRRHVEGYVRDLVHEFKAPLAAIRASGELLEDAGDLAERRRLAGLVQTQAGRLADLTQRLLELARLERLDAPPQRERVDLAALAQTCADDLAPLAGGRSIAISGSGAVLGDPAMLRIALGNLLGNALRFAPEGGRVEIAVTDGLATVRDRGPGIPDYALPRLCERFYALPGADGAKGTGLGLSISREIARLHGGGLVLRNREGGGAEAELRIG